MTPQQLKRIYEENARRRQRLVMRSMFLSSVTSGPASGSSGSGGTSIPVSTDGWQITEVSPTDLSMTALSVSRQGFDATGTPVTIADTVYKTKRVRQAYPNHASFTTDKVALSDYLYTGDTAVGLTNSSTEASPKPIANWVMPTRLVVGNSVHWELVAFHRNARLGRQVAAVKVRANDGTTQTAWQTVATTVISSTVEDAQPVEVYQGDINITTLATGDFWLEAEVYPWFGGDGSVLRSEDVLFSTTANRRQFTRAYFVKNVTRAVTPNYVYVSSTGNNTTGVVSTNAATAAATPCLTVCGALLRAAAALGSGLGTFDGLRIRIVDTVNTGTTGFAYTGFGNGAVVIERAPGTARAAAIVNIDQNFHMSQAGASPSSNAPSHGEIPVVFNDVTLNNGGAFFFVSNTGRVAFGQFWNVNFTGNVATMIGGGLSVFAAFGFNCGSSYTNTFSGASTAVRCTRGITADWNGGQPSAWNMVGCKYSRSSGFQFTTPATDGVIIFNNKVLLSQTSSAPIGYSLGGTTPGPLGAVAIVQNLVERIDTSGTGNMLVGADLAYGNIVHAVIHHNTSAGARGHGRYNIAYDDTAANARTHKLISFKGNLTPQINTKGDIFVSDGTRTGNFPFVHGVGCEGNFAEDVDAAGGSDSFRQSYPGRFTIINGGDSLFVSDQAVSGTGPFTAGAGGGDYDLQAGSPAINILSTPVLAFDLAGVARGTGAQAAGAYAA